MKLAFYLLSQSILYKAHTKHTAIHGTPTTTNKAKTIISIQFHQMDLCRYIGGIATEWCWYASNIPHLPYPINQATLPGVANDIACPCNELPIGIIIVHRPY